MLDFKLQIGCLLIIVYIEINYIFETYNAKAKCSRLYDTLLIIAPWAVIFDGFTAWSVNRTDTVPDFVNKIAHLLFFILMDLATIVTALYIFDRLIGFGRKRKKLLLGLPGFLSLILVVLQIGGLEYIEGSITWYSMGVSVYICYATVIFYYTLVLFFVISRRRFIAKDKFFGTLSFIIIAGVILLAQIIFPEVLLTSLFPTILVLGIYFYFENPAFQKVTAHTNDMADGFATMVESRDNNTGGHIRRTKAYVKLMLDKMRDDMYYRRMLSKDYMTNVTNAAPLHDIGKIATPDSILQKPGKLTDEEYAIMKEHSSEGGKIILQTFRDLDNSDFRQIAYEVARFHHEKYNGKGYPDGLKAEEIPLHARIMAIADVFDAISQKRCYRDAMPIDKCFEIIKQGKGTDFDPFLVDIFLKSREEVIQLMHEEEETEESVRDTVRS